MSSTSDRVTFRGHAGELSARLHKTPAAPRAHALFAHCFTCSKDLRAAITIANALAARGIAVLRFDFTGLGDSEGDFADTNFSSNVDDLVAAADYLRSIHAAPHILVGHSLGGAAVLAAASRIPETVAVATIGAPAEPTHVKHMLSSAQEEIERTGVAEVVLAGRKFRIKKQFLDDLDENILAKRVATLGRALLICHAPRDQYVGIENASKLFLAAKHPKSYVSLDDADHLLTRSRDAEYAGQVIAAWADRYIPAFTEPTQPEHEHTEVFVRTGFGFATNVLAGGHPLRSDEPLSLGGTDTGPTPYDLLLSALGTCTSITLRMYADRKKWPLEAVSISLRHGKIHARDCEECETATGKVDRIDKTITLEGPLDDEQRQRLLHIADRCPVHRTLLGEIVIHSELAPA